MRLWNIFISTLYEPQIINLNQRDQEASADLASPFFKFFV